MIFADTDGIHGQSGNVRGASPLHGDRFQAIGWSHHGRAPQLTGEGDVLEAPGPAAAMAQMPTTVHLAAPLGADPLLKEGLATSTKVMLAVLGVAAIGGALVMISHASPPRRRRSR